MKKLIPFLMLTLATGCAGYVTKDQQAQMNDTYLYRLIDACPTSDPLMHRARLVRIQNDFAVHENVGRAKTEMLNACPGLTIEQRRGYWELIQAAGREYRHTYRVLATQEHRRRAAYVQNAGRTIMEIQRTDDLDRIRRNQDAGL